MSYETHHTYDILLGPNDPAAVQPDRVTTPLKPHQLAALQKALVMEQKGRVAYNVTNPIVHLNDPIARHRAMFRGRFEIETNIGILGDMVGYGKTLTALSIIAANTIERIQRKMKDLYCYHARNYAHFTVVCDRIEEVSDTNFIQSTLIVAPRGPVFHQWEQALRLHTTLNALVIDNLHDIRKRLPPSGASVAVLRAFFEQYDAVLITSTTLKTLMDHYETPYHPHPIQAWERIMVDEAHDIINRVPLFSFRFMWLITATYKSLLLRTFSGRTVMAYGIRDILDEERMNLVLVRGAPEFVMRSFDVPALQEYFYLCVMPATLSALHGICSPAVQERIDANDIQGAIRELGGQHETEDDIVALVTREIQRDIHNREHEMQYIQNLEIPQEAREERLTRIRTDLERLRDRHQSLLDRVSALSSKLCSICYDTYSHPVMLPCTHVFCGGCILQWMQKSRACPECRQPISARGMIAIVHERPQDASTSGASNPSSIDTKENTLMKILREKPQGKFLVFSTCDHTFHSLVQRLENEGIRHAELKGSTSSMMHILERFREGSLKVIMLNTHHAGSGIDISCATDVIMFHKMGDEGTQAIGRAQRVGRTSPLHVHHLCYPHEFYSDNNH